jgi:hypothetical protein
MLFPVIGLFVAVIGVMRQHYRQLNVSIETSEPHGFVVRLACARPSHVRRPPHPAPNVRDDRETPLLRSTGCESGYSCFYLAVKVNSENPKLMWHGANPGIAGSAGAL